MKKLLDDVRTIDLLQVNATLIAGAIIFLTVSLAALDPTTDAQIPQLSAEGLPTEIQIMIFEFNAQATEELTIAAADARSGEMNFRITATAFVIIPLCISAVFTIFGWRPGAIVALLIGLMMIAGIMVIMLNTGAGFRDEVRNRTQIGSDELQNKLEAIKNRIAELKINGTTYE